MDCSDARTYLPLLTLPPVSGLTDELQAAQQHVERCADCRTALRREAASDRELSRQMSAVHPPDGLADRLQQQIAAQYAQLAVSAPARFDRRPWLWTTVAAAVVLALITPLLFQTFSPTTISTVELFSLVEQTPGRVDRVANPPQDIPIGWSDSAWLITQPYSRKIDAPIPLHGASFQFRPGRSAVPIAGTLWMVDAGLIRDADRLPPLESAQIEYGPGRLTWRENAVVFIVLMNGRSLDQLQRKLMTSRSLA